MRQIIKTSESPAAVGPYSQAIVVRGMLFTAGQIALIPGEEPKLDNESIEVETHRVMGNLQAILDAAGCRFADVVASRIYITSRAIFPEVNQAYSEYFTKDEEPARECVVAEPPLEGAHVEISMIAVIPEQADNQIA